MRSFSNFFLFAAAWVVGTTHAVASDCVFPDRVSTWSAVTAAKHYLERAENEPDPTQSRHWYARVVECRPHLSLTPFLKLTSFYLEQGALGPAEQLIDLGLHFHPASSDLRLSKALVLGERQKMDAAAALCRELEKEVSKSDVQRCLMRVFTEQKKAAEAHRAAQTYLTLLEKETGTPSPGAYFEAAWAFELGRDGERYSKGAKLTEARETLEKAVAGGVVWAAFHLGLVHSHLENFREAINSTKLYLRHFPMHAVATYNLACFYSRLGEVDSALLYLNEAVSWGFRDRKHIEKDEDLKALRTTEGYRKIRARLPELAFPKIR